MSHDQTRVLMVGGGRNSAVGMAHVSALRLSGIGPLVAGKWSKDNNESRSSALYYGLNASCAKDLEELESNSTDALVVVSLPPTDLSGSIEGLLEKAKLVFQEKPVALDSTQFREFMKHRGSQPWFFNYTYLGFPMVRRMREIIRSGELGTVRRVEIEMPQETFLRADAKPQSWRLHDYTIPTVSLDLGTHVLSLAHYLFDGFEIRDLSSRKTRLPERDNLVVAVDVLGRSAGNFDFYLSWSKYCLGMRNGLTVRIFGDRGSLEWVEEQPDQLLSHDNLGGTAVVRRSSPGAGSADLRRYNRFKAGHPTGYIEALANLYEDIRAVISSNDYPVDSLTTLSSLQIMEQLEAIDEASLEVQSDRKR